MHWWYTKIYNTQKKTDSKEATDEATIAEGKIVMYMS